MRKVEIDYLLKARLPITVFVIVIAIGLTYYISRPARDGVGYQPTQPINFSHELHAGQMGIDCKYCHVGVDKGRHAMIPSEDICMNCHSIARKTRPEIVKMTAFFDSNKPVPWLRVHRLPDFVYFNHSVHVNMGIDCIHCHEDIRKQAVVAQVHSFTMAKCLDCHRNPVEKMPELAGKITPGPTNCGACHR